jgi:hypothetical protein
MINNKNICSEQEDVWFVLDMMISWGWLIQLTLEAASARVLLKDLYGFDLPDDITTSLVCVFMNWDHQDLEGLVLCANYPNLRSVLVPRQPAEELGRMQKDDASCHPL